MIPKVKVVLTGPETITSATIKWLKGIFQLFIVDGSVPEYALSNLIQAHEAIGLIHGGATCISDMFFESCPLIRWNIFIGIEPFPIYTQAALSYCRKNNIPVYSTGGGIRAVAETTCQQISEPTLLKKRATGWRRRVPINKKKYHAVEGLSVIGLGNLAREILLHCQASREFERTIFSGRKDNPEFSQKTGIPYAPMEEAFKADVVILTIAHIPGVTDGYIDGKLLRKIRPNGLLIDNVRIQIINVPDLLVFARERPDVTIIIDVSEAEIEQEYGRVMLEAIKRLPNIALTGHTAWEKAYTIKEYSAGTRKVVAENNLA